jgi:hypothetical protein
MWSSYYIKRVEEYELGAFLPTNAYGDPEGWLLELCCLRFVGRIWDDQRGLETGTRRRFGGWDGEKVGRLSASQGEPPVGSWLGADGPDFQNRFFC